MKARLITNGIISLIATVAYTLVITLTIRVDSSSGAIFTFSTNEIVKIIRSLLIALSILVSVVMGIITLAMAKHENARGITIASGVLAVLAIFLIPILVNWIVSFIGVYTINKAKKEIIEEQKIVATTNQTAHATSEETPST